MKLLLENWRAYLDEEQINEKMMLKVRRVEEIKRDTGLEIEMAAELIKDKKLWEKLSVNGKKFVSENFDWKEISQKLDMIYKEIGNKGTNHAKKS